MENIKLTVNKNEKSEIIRIKKIFLWNLVKEEEISDEKVQLSFERADSKNYHTRLVELERKNSPKFIPLFLCFLPALLNVILVTIFLIIVLSKPEGFDKSLWAIIFFVPSGILLFLTVVLTTLRLKKMEAYVKNKDQMLQDAIKEINEFTNK